MLTLLSLQSPRGMDGMVGVKELSISSNKRVGVRGATVYFGY